MRKKIFVRAPCLSQSGYGEQSRFALRALRSQEHMFDIYIQPIPWGQTGWIYEDSEFRQWMDTRIIETQLMIQQKQLQPDMSLQITIPNEFEKIAPLNFGYTAGIETTKVAPKWLQSGNEKVDKILVVSEHAKTSYENTITQARLQNGEIIPYKLETPIEVVWETTPRATAEEIPGLQLENDFNFLVVSQMGIRKNFTNTIQWWVEEFIDQEVGLVVKTNIKSNSRLDLNATETSLKAILDKYPDRKCKVYLLHGDLSVGQMTGLYTHPKIKALINLSHGEGFGLPMFEAAREGLPIITVGWSGQLDFLRHNNKDYFLNVSYELNNIQPEAVWNGVIEPDSSWAFAEQGSYKISLRMMYKKWEEMKTQANELKSIVEEKFNKEVLYANFCKAILGHGEIDIDDWLEELEGDIIEQE